MKPEIKQLADNYIDAERKLLAQLNELEKSGEKCTCEEPDYIAVLSTGDEHYGDELVASEYCLHCGGDKEQ